MLENAEHPTASRAEHPLVEYLHSTERWLAREDFASARVEGYLLEVAGLVTLLRARHRDPRLPEHIASMVVAERSRHDVAVLGVAYQFERDAANHVLLARKGPGELGRIPDLWLDADGRPRLQLEVKSPVGLQFTGTPLSSKVAMSAVGCAISAAREPPKGQFFSGVPGVAVVASYEFGEGGQTVLREAAENRLADIHSPNPFLAGLLLLDMTRTGTFTPCGSPTEVGNVTNRTARWRITWTSRQEFVRNRTYRGDVQFAITEGHLPAKDLVDLSE